MKILYVKHNSERSKEFQLKTIIYEENGGKFVKKQAICSEAIPHLLKMKDNAKKLQDSIINPKIKLANIIKETKDSLTFEYIEGVSLQQKYHLAKKVGKENEIMELYNDLLSTGFKTTLFDVNTMVNDKLKKIFGDFDYSEFHEQLCFKNVSNIDLLFSNIIFQDDFTFIIDYEWVYGFNIPTSFASYRALHQPNPLHEKMEEHFIHNIVVNNNGFFKIQNQYRKDRHPSILKHIDSQTQYIKELRHTIILLTQKMHELTLKGRIKKVLKIIFPIKVLQKLKALKMI